PSSSPFPAGRSSDLAARRGFLPCRDGARVDRQHDALRPEPLGHLAQHLGPGDGRGVDRDLVGAGAQQAVDVLDGADAASDRERDEHLLGGARDDVEHGAAVAARRGDVEEGQFVGALFVVEGGELDRITRIAQVLEVDTLDHPPRIHVEARDDPHGQRHVRSPSEPNCSATDCSVADCTISSISPCTPGAAATTDPDPIRQGLPAKSVAMPPAARTSATPAALSQGWWPNTTAPPIAPPAVNARSAPVEPCIRSRATRRLSSVMTARRRVPGTRPRLSMSKLPTAIITSSSRAGCSGSVGLPFTSSGPSAIPAKR